MSSEYIFLFCLTNIQVICANFSIQLFELRATFNFAIISRRRSPASSRLRLGKGYRKYSSPCRRTLIPGGPAASQSCRTTIDLCVAGAHDGAGTTSRLLCCLPPLLVGTCLSILGPPPLDCPWALAGLFRGRRWAAMGRIWLPDQRWHQYTDQRIRGGISIDTNRHAKYAINIETTRIEMASLLLLMQFQTAGVKCFFVFKNRHATHRRDHTFDWFWCERFQSKCSSPADDGADY